ncbi:putative protein N-terminal and lysine N-methyltransferase EFM7 [Paratrimastix pyriformis]|uniref:Uncharacterized protein n=1 Tax=Paratrimastix pyriformis TaxID=342808 RepID=A0ABQ8UC41_9EUKA|nr:putative protein N-terminal and lysine N-methyltransferase EFM7 [Paratrimastix pyriformis]
MAQLGTLFGEEAEDGWWAEESQTVTVNGAGVPDPIAIRELQFHVVNAHKVWPFNERFMGWINRNQQYFQGKHILELGSGTGVLAIYMKKMGWDVTSSDYDDAEIEANIVFNATANHTSFPHIRYTWGTPLPESLSGGKFDLIVANDILLYVAQYDALMDSLKRLLWAATVPGQPRPMALFCWHRKAKGVRPFFEIAAERGFEVDHIDAHDKVWLIRAPPQPTPTAVALPVPTPEKDSTTPSPNPIAAAPAPTSTNPSS